MKLVALFLLTLGVFSEDEDHRDQGTIEKDYRFNLPANFFKDSLTLTRDFQIHCDTDSGISITFNDENECIEITQEGKPKGFHAGESQCFFTMKIDSECMDEYFDHNDPKADNGSHLAKAKVSKENGKTVDINFKLSWNNIKKFEVEDPTLTPEP